MALGLSACGGGGKDSASEPPPPASPSDFPSAKGKTFEELRRELGPGPVLAPTVATLETGRNRFGFGLFDRARKQIADAPAAVYFASSDGGKVHGPYPARYESLEVDPRFRSETVAKDPDSAESVYVTSLPFKEAGRYRALAAVKLDDRLVAADLAGSALSVVDDSPIPEVGQKAIRIDTPTKTDVGGDLSKIDTRVPPSTMHEVNFAEALGKKPIVLAFSTPGLCQSRVCGPVIDIAEELKAKYGDKADFIHMEIYKDNELEKGLRPQVAKWNLRTEPWLFTVSKDGKVAGRLEGAFSARELEGAIKAALKG